MGNDDIMCAGALENVVERDRTRPKRRTRVEELWLRWMEPRTRRTRNFYGLTKKRCFRPARQPIALRSGVPVSWQDNIVHRDSAAEAATAKSDGTPSIINMHLSLRMS